MKKIFAVLSSLLIFMGVKAQTSPTVKKETEKPVATVKPINVDSMNATTTGTNLKQTNKSIKIDHIKKTDAIQMKDLPATSKPVKG